MRNFNFVISALVQMSGRRFSLPAGIPPSFSAAPVILGTPTVGTPVTFNSGTASGTPAPTLTPQWLLDSVDISGATAATYTPVAGDEGSNRLSIRQTATNASGSAVSTSAVVSIAAAAAPTLLSSSIDSTGLINSRNYSTLVTHGAGGNLGNTISATNGAATLTYLDGAGTSTLRYTISRAIQSSEVVTGSYTQPGNGVEAAAGGADVVSYSNAGITNGSTQGSTALTSFTLTSAATTGTHPFTLGIGFPQGQVPSSFTTNLTNYQVSVMRRWNDGSVKHAIVSGRAALTSGSPLTVTVNTGTPPTGTALTSASIQTAAPSASIQCGGLGTVNLSSLLASPFRTFISGPEMVECHYRSNVGTGDLSAWFHVRLYADGRVRVHAIVENGYIDNAAGNALANSVTQTYIPTITIGGTTVYNNGGASFTHQANTRYMVEGWIGTNPQVTPLLTASHLRSTKLVPNHSVAASATMLNALGSTYVPGSSVDQNPDMGGTGYAPSIGLLPNWNAAYASSGDARAFRSTLANSSALNSFGIVWRSQVTQAAVKPSTYATWTVLATTAGGGSDGNGRGTLNYERNHAPGEGYLAYLLTGDYWHLETLSMQASYLYLSINSNRGNGTSRVPDTGQTRGYAWTLRTWGLYAAIAPDSDMGAGSIGADYRALVANAYTSLQTTKNAGSPMAFAGSLFQSLYSQWETGASGTPAVGSIAPWMTDFMTATHGFLSEIQPLTSTATQIEVRDWSYRFVVSRLGRAGIPDEFNFTQAAQYGMKVSSASPFDNNWYTWGEIWQQSMGTPNTTVSNTLTGGNIADANAGMQSYWGNMLPAIGYAVDHNAPGAIDGYERLVGASNWSTITAKWADNPVWAVAPRNPPTVLTLPYSVPAAGVAALIGVNQAAAVKPAAVSTFNWAYATFNAYGAGVMAPDASRRGAYVIAGSGGHNAPGLNDALLFNFDDASWNLRPTSDTVALDPAHFNTTDFVNGGAAMTADGWSEIVAAQPDNVPLPSHLYQSLTYLPWNLANNSKGAVFRYGQSAVTQTPTRNGPVHKLNLDGTGKASWARVASGSRQFGSGDFTFERVSVVDTRRRRVYIFGELLHAFAQAEYVDLATGTLQLTSGYGSPASWATNYHTMWYDHARDLIVQYMPGSGIRVLQAGNFSAGWTAVTTSGTEYGEACRPAYFPPTGGYYFRKTAGGGQNLTKLTPPAIGSNALTGTWAWSTVTFTGATIPEYADANSAGTRHYQNLVLVPDLNTLAWLSGTDRQVALLTPGS